MLLEFYFDPCALNLKSFVITNDHVILIIPFVIGHGNFKLEWQFATLKVLFHSFFVKSLIYEIIGHRGRIVTRKKKKGSHGSRLWWHPITWECREVLLPVDTNESLKALKVKSVSRSLRFGHFIADGMNLNLPDYHVPNKLVVQMSMAFGKLTEINLCANPIGVY